MALPLLSAKLPPISMLAWASAPSPASVLPHWPSSSSPWKFLRSLKFTTPATASAPYTAEAPPVMISTPSIAEVGMVFRSITRAALAGWARRPSSSTRVRLAPRPRRFTVEMPTVLVALGCWSPPNWV